MRLSNSSKDDTTPPSDQDSTEAHKNEGFLKSAWHRLTHQHDHLTEENTARKDGTTAEGEATRMDGKTDEEPKKESGSGAA